MKLKLKTVLLILLFFSMERAFCVVTFNNPIVGTGADPWIIFKDGYYYYLQTTGGSIVIWKSDRITTVGSLGSATVFTPPPPHNQNVWAPELHYLNGKWYLYYTAGTTGDPSDVSHRNFCAEGNSQDPMGTYTLKGQLTATGADYWSIDPTVFETGGVLYYAWCSRAGAANDGISRVYIATLSNPWTVSSSRVQVAAPTYSWEGNICEAPEFIQYGPTVNIVYSANCACGNSYCLGLAINSGNLLDAWTKNATPVFKSANGVYAPGHCSFTKSISGNEDWIVFHTAKYSGAGYNREVHAQKFTWNTTYQTPYFGSPQPNSTPLEVPNDEYPASRQMNTDFMTSDGRLVTFGVFNDGSVRANAQVSSNGAFGGWGIVSPGTGFSCISPLKLANDTFLCYGVGNGTPVWLTTQTNVNGGWTPWTSLGGTFSFVEGLRFANGRNVAFACGGATYPGSGTPISFNSQTSSNGSWTGWQVVAPGTGFAHLSPILTPDQRLTCFGVGYNSPVWMSVQTNAGSGFSAWNNLGGTFSFVRACQIPDGRYVVFACGNRTEVYAKTQISTNGTFGTWGSWQLISSGTGFTRIKPIYRSDGIFICYGAGDGTAGWINWQTAPNSAWAGWNSLTGAGFRTIHGLVAPDLRNIAFAHGYNSAGWIDQQTTPGGSWTGWQSLGGSLK